MIMPMKLRTPPASALLAKAAGLPNGGGRPSSDAPVAKLAREQLREIARVKLPGRRSTGIAVVVDAWSQPTAQRFPR
jgi:large subunit ribosomal protein L11